MKKGLLFLGMVLFWVTGSTASFGAIPLLINYQGNLTDSDGEPLSGTYLVNFALYDASSGGSSLWAEQQSVEVDNGIFRVNLGAVTPFDGREFSYSELYLQLEIDNGGWELLSPRQQLTSTGFAIRAADSDTLEGSSVADLDGRYVNEGQIGGITSTMLAASAVTTAAISDNSINGSKITSGAVSSGQVADNSLTAADLAAGSVGNEELANGAVTTSKIQAGAVTSASLADGATLLEISDDDGAGSGLDADYLDGFSSGSFTLQSQDFGRSGVSSTLYEGTATLSSRYVNEGQTNSVTSDMIVTNAVGVSEINFPLNYTSSDTNGGLVAMINTAAGSDGNYPAALYGGTNGGAGAYNVFGVLGSAPALGTTNTALALLPNAQIAVAGAAQDGYGVVGTSTSHYHGGMYAEGSRGYGIYAVHTDPSYTAPAVYGKNQGSGIGVLGDASTGSSSGVLGRTTSSTGVGVRGQGAVSTNYGELGKDGIGVEAQGSLYAGKFVGDVITYYGTSRVAQMDVSDYSLHMYNTSGTQTIEIDSDYNGNGRVITQELQITGGSDLSEQFDINPLDFAIQPGMVVSIDPDKPGKLIISSDPYDNKVAGIISGAGDIKPGMMMGQAGSEADGAHPVALSGRVYCYVDTANGPVVPGDLLTTSSTPGYAMKVTDHSRALGAIIGKAMSALPEGKGLVLALVSLQ